MKAYEYIIRLAALKKLEDKKALLRAAAVDGCDELFYGLQLGIDKKRIFGVKTSPLIEIDDTFSQKEINQPGSYTWPMFKAMIGLLEKEDTTEETKNMLLREAAEESGILEWNAFYRPIVMKNIKCGITATIINSILNEFGPEAEKYKIPIWKIKKLSNNGFMTGKKYIEPLLSGSRMLVVMDREYKTIKAYSETGRIIKNPKINLSGLYGIIGDLPESIVFDGNITNRSYQGLMSGPSDEDYYVIYDIVLLRDFNQNYCPLGLSSRKDTLNEFQSLLRVSTDRKAYVLPSLLIDFSTENADQRFYFYTEELKQAGYTEIVIKDANSEYNCEKDIMWFKQPIK
jgi:DNA ligase-1